ncbi:MAG: PAS domain S-box protein [Bacteroidales bacterium]
MEYGKKTKEQLIAEINNLNKKNIHLSEKITRISEEMKHARSGLKENEKKFKKLIEHINDVIFEVDHTGIIKYISPGIRKIIGYSSGDIIGNHFKSFVGENAGKLIARLQELSVRKSIDNEYRLQTKDGKSKWIRISTRAKYESGHFAGGIGTIVDINSTKEMEVQLKKSEELYRSLINTSPDCIIITDLDGYISFISPAAIKMFGLSNTKSFIGKRILEFVAGSNQDKVLEDLKNISKKKYKGSSEYLAVKSDGTEFFIEVTGDLIKDHAGQPKSIMYISRDISDRKLAENALIISEQKYRTLVETINEVVFQVSDKGIINYLSPSFKTISGYKPEELYGTSFLDIIHSEHQQEVQDLLINLGKKRTHKSKLRIITKSEAIIWISINVVPLKNGSGVYGGTGSFTDITHQVEVETEVSKLLRVVEQTHLSILIMDMNGVIEYVNDRACETSGYTRKELYGKKFGELNTSDNPDEKYSAIWEVISRGDIWQGVFQNSKKDGTLYLESARVSPITDMRGKITNYMAVKEDITEKLLVEKALIENEANLNYAQEMARMGHWELDLLTGKSKWSKNLYKVLGLSIGEIEPSYDYIRNHVHPDDLYIVDQMLNDIEQRKSKIETQFRLILPDDTTRWVQSNIVPVYEVDRTIALKGVTMDISEKIESNAELDKLWLAVNQSPVAIVITDLNARVEYVNPAFETITGYSLQEMKGRNMNIVQSGKTEKRVYEELWSTIKQGKVWKGEIHNRRKNGKLYMESMSINPVRDRNGTVANYLAVKEDITDRKKAEQKIRDLNINLEHRIEERTKDLQNARKEAEQANMAKSEFLANMSHEIRTPLNAILGYSELLAPIVTDGIKKEYVHSIKSSGKSLLTLINDILDLTKIEVGMMNLSFEFIQTQSFFNEFQRIFDFQINEKGLQLHTIISSETPPYLYIDSVRLRQVVLNLLGNAVKFTEQGEIFLKVDAEFKGNPGNKSRKNEDLFDLVIKVKDTGIGISGEMQKKIFESFIQARGKSEKGGAGLGLAISKRLVELMRGEITLQSETGKGSTFTVKIPEIKFMQDYQPEKEEEVIIDPGIVSFDKCTVLIIDDVDHNRKFLRDCLANTALTALEAENGSAALEIMNYIKPDLIITDIRMPGINGFELLEKIKEREKLKDVPVLAYSASAMKDQKEKILKSAFNGLLVKPLQINDLYHKLMEFLPHTIKGAGEQKNEDETAPTVQEMGDISGLLQVLEGDGLEIWGTLQKRQPVNEVKEFGTKLIELGGIHQSTYISDYGHDLVSAVENFNIQKMMHFLKKYPDIIKKINENNHGNNR